jgi:hypothetical protein
MIFFLLKSKLCMYFLFVLVYIVFFLIYAEENKDCKLVEVESRIETRCRRAGTVASMNEA